MDALRASIKSEAKKPAAAKYRLAAPGEGQGGTLKDADGSLLEGLVSSPGAWPRMSRAEAFALVAARGGVPRRGVTRQTGVLVVGELGWPLLANGRPSNSLSRARTYQVPVVSERRFREWVGKATPEAQAWTYTPEQTGVPQRACRRTSWPSSRSSA